MKELICDEIRQALHGRWAAGMAPRSAAASATGVSTDSRHVREGDLFVAIRGERLDGHDYLAQAIRAGAAAAVVRRDYLPPADLPAPRGGLIVVEDPTRSLGDLAAYYRGHMAAKVVAVTGSNGKTTAKRMIHRILAARLAGTCSPKSFNNNIGVPLTLLGVRPADNYVVCEVGSNAPGEIAELGKICRPHVAVITSVGPTHLERLGSIEGVAAEKASLLGELETGGVGVVCGRSGAGAGADALEKALRAYGKHVIRFGDGEECEVRLTDYRPGEGVSRFQVNGRLMVELPAPGRHNAMNALAAMTVAQRFGIDLAEAAEALASFEGTEMRLQELPAGSVTILNDAYNANPASVAAAADVLAERGTRPGRRRVFVAGDMLELGERSAELHRETGRHIARSGIDLLIGVGTLARNVVQGAADAGAKAVALGSVEEAVAELPRLLRPGDVVLLKGSRGMALERLVAPIRQAFDAAGETPATPAGKPNGPLTGMRATRKGETPSPQQTSDAPAASKGDPL